MREYDIEVSEFELQSNYYNDFSTNTQVRGMRALRVPLRFFYMDDFDIKYPAKVHMLMSKKRKKRQQTLSYLSLER